VKKEKNCEMFKIEKKSSKLKKQVQNWEKKMLFKFEKVEFRE
jgi:hypothetical protein